MSKSENVIRLDEPEVSFVEFRGQRYPIEITGEALDKLTEIADETRASVRIPAVCRALVPSLPEDVPFPVMMSLAARLDGVIRRMMDDLGLPFGGNPDGGGDSGP